MLETALSVVSEQPKGEGLPLTKIIAILREQGFQINTGFHYDLERAMLKLSRDPSHKLTKSGRFGRYSITE